LADQRTGARQQGALAPQVPRATRSSEFESEDSLLSFEYFQKNSSLFSILTFLFCEILLSWRLLGVIPRQKTMQNTTGLKVLA